MERRSTTHQSAPAAPPDSLGLLREARTAQARFERTRVFHSPRSRWSGGGECDEQVGRFCLRFGGEDPDEDRPSWTPPPDAPEVAEAREELLALLARVAEAIPGDGWVAGQRVSYLAASGRWDEALSAARACRTEGWWCDGLEGVALHGAGRIAEAEDRFERVLAALPEERRREWNDPAPLGELDLLRALDRADGDDLRERTWRLSDPLFLLPGNAVRSEHLARWVLAETRRDAQNGHGLSWGSDMTRLLVRFGPVVAYERLDRSLMHMGPTPTVGRYDPESRHLIPSATGVLDPVASRAEDWRTDRRRARSRHAPPPAPRIHALELQVARFRRGEHLLLAAAWSLPSGPEEADGSDPAGNPEGPEPAEGAQAVDALERPEPAEGARDVDELQRPESAEGTQEADALQRPESAEGAQEAGELETGFFLLDGETLELTRHPALRLDGPRGVAHARIPVGGYLASLEALDREGRRSWRDRRGVTLDPLRPGAIQVSDLLLLVPDPEREAGPPRSAAPAPVDADSPHNATPSSAHSANVLLDSLLARAHPRTTLKPGPVEIAWEVYGLSPDDESLRFELRATPDEGGLLRRMGERLGLLSSPTPVEVQWEEGVLPDRDWGEPHLRRVVLDLSGLEEGTYHLRLAVTAAGRTPAVATRAVELVTGGPASASERR